MKKLSITCIICIVIALFFPDYWPRPWFMPKYAVRMMYWAISAIVIFLTGIALWNKKS